MVRKLFENKVWIWIIGIFLIARILYSIIGAAVLWEGDPVTPRVGNQIYETRSVTVKEGWQHLSWLAADICMAIFPMGVDSLSEN